MAKLLDYGKCVGYGVEFRNMHTAIHGILVYADEDDALYYEDLAKSLDRVKTDEDYEFIANRLYDEAIDIIEEINYRDTEYVDGEKIYAMYSDEFVIIVNRIAVDI